jgi:hypothetical protein
VSFEVRRGPGKVLVRVRGDDAPDVHEMAPDAARLLARRLTDAARDVECQIPEAGNGWELQEFE